MRAFATKELGSKKISRWQSLGFRLIAVFVLLAAAITAVLSYGVKNAFSVGWRDLTRPLVIDYVDRLAADLGSPPSIERATQLTQRLPLSVKISGPVVNWSSPNGVDAVSAQPEHEDRPRFLTRTIADGHRVEFGLNFASMEHRPRGVFWLTLLSLLALSAFAYFYIRRLLHPLEDIRLGAQRYGRGQFDQAIPVKRRDELGMLAGDVNAMARDIHQMLEAKRGLLLAISHELRSPLTRARLNIELLPETAEIKIQRQALLSDLGSMRDLISDLLESERLAGSHSALVLESVDLKALVLQTIHQMHLSQVADSQHLKAADIKLECTPDLPKLSLDATRVRLLLRNLIDNALRHGAQADEPPRVSLELIEHQVVLKLRDFGPGVPADALARLAEPFYRPDLSRDRLTGGIGLGLYLCKLVVQAHGARWQVRNAAPGLEISVAFALGQKI